MVLVLGEIVKLAMKFFMESTVKPSLPVGSIAEFFPSNGFRFTIADIFGFFSTLAEVRLVSFPTGGNSKQPGYLRSPKPIAVVIIFPAILPGVTELVL